MADPVLDPEFAPPPPSAAKPTLADPQTRAFLWLHEHERGVIVAAIAFQVLVLAAMIVSQIRPTLGAPTVLLRVIPVDPRDLMRGDYVILGYDISQNWGQPFEPGSTVYVSLVPEADGRHYRKGSVSTSPPATGPFIRGTVEGWNRITFGIESYYVQEGKGRDYENAIRTRKLSARVALASDGRAQLRGLVFD